MIAIADCPILVCFLFWVVSMALPGSYKAFWSRERLCTGSCWCWWGFGSVLSWWAIGGWCPSQAGGGLAGLCSCECCLMVIWGGDQSVWPPCDPSGTLLSLSEWSSRPNIRQSLCGELRLRMNECVLGSMHYCIIEP